MAGQMVHLEIPAGDTAKAREFWGGLFGWQFQAFEGAPSEYLTTRFSETTGGAIYEAEGDKRGPRVYFDVDDINSGVALLGLTATLGIFVYELRNAQLYDAMIQRAKELERLLELPTVQGVQGAGGVLAMRPRRWFAHGRGWTLVYSAAIAGWSYLAAWGILRWFLVDSAQTIAAVTGIAVGFLVAAGLERFKAGG